MKQLLALSVTLVACSAVPLSIAIPDYDSPVAANSATITFQQTSQTQAPPTPVKSISIQGQITYNQTATLEFYTSDTPPCGTVLGGVYTCSFDPSTMEKVGESALQAGVAQSFSWSSSRLTNGINQKTLYIGVALKSGLLSGGTLQFRNLVARVAVF